ncbi:MAG: hypothetical protein K9M00_02985 [Candidatus Omnitrophica bacterium]|nr:hypothetical protein [Candidatus Omnitrophota bacterium]
MDNIFNFKLKLCSRDDLDDLYKFIKKMQGRGLSFFSPSASKNFLKERYRSYSNPTLTFNAIIIKKNKDEIVGYGGSILFEGMLNSKKIKGAIGCDLMIDPDYRKEFPMLFSCLFSGYKKFFKDRDFFLTFPNDNQIEQTFKKIKWRSLATVYNLFCPFSLAAKLDFSSDKIKIKKNDFSKKMMSHFFKRVSSQYYFLMQADADFLEWKYFYKPDNNYTIYTAVLDKKILGYIIAEKRRSSIYLVDIVIDLKFFRVFFLLLSDIFTRSTGQKYKEVRCSVSHKLYLENLKKIGFSCYQKENCLYSDLGKKSFFSLPKNKPYHFNGLIEDGY